MLPTKLWLNRFWRISTNAWRFSLRLRILGSLSLNRVFSIAILASISWSSSLALEWRDPLAFPRLVQIEETGETIDLPHQDIVAFGRLKDHEGLRANDIVLRHPRPELDRFISRWHFELRRVADGLRLRALSEGHTTVDGQPAARGVDLPVRTGSLIGVAQTLTLRLTLPPSMLDNEHSRTMTVIRQPTSRLSSDEPGRPPVSAD